MWGFCAGLCFGMHYFVPFLVLQSYVEEERACCFAFSVFWMSCCCKCTVALPHGDVGCSAVCDCCISCSYSLICFIRAYSASCYWYIAPQMEHSFSFLKFYMKVSSP